MRHDLYGSLTSGFHEKEMEGIFASEAWHCRFITDENNRVIGLVELSSRNIVDGCLSSPVAYLEGLYLAPEHRGKGIGSDIIKILIQWCKKKGYSEFATDTEIKNEKAQRFYKSLGFKEVDRVVEYRLELNNS